jgi:hypothetical protein
MEVKQQTSPLFRGLEQRSIDLVEDLPEWARFSRYRTRVRKCPWRYRITLTKEYPVHKAISQVHSSGMQKAFNIPASENKKGTPTFEAIVNTMFRVIQYHIQSILYHLSTTEYNLDWRRWDLIEDSFCLTGPYVGIIPPPTLTQIGEIQARVETAAAVREEEKRGGPLSQEEIVVDESSDDSDDYDGIPPLVSDSEDGEEIEEIEDEEGRQRPIPPAEGLQQSLLFVDQSYRSSEDEDYVPDQRSEYSDYSSSSSSSSSDDESSDESGNDMY